MKLYLVGGFLGSGKTTAIVTASKILLQRKTQVAVIVNDQGSQLVDAAFTGSHDIPGSQVSNGCFYCNYEKLHSAIENFSDSIHPQIIFAEAVGSCTDLVATIVKPILKFDPEIEIIFSVFADAMVLLSLLEVRSSFINENIQYIYKKQLEEAAILIVNKSDTLTQNELQRMQMILESQYLGKELVFQDSRDEGSVQQWLDLLNKKSQSKIPASLDIDYTKYAKGEAALAWLDASLTIYSKREAIDKSFEIIQDMVDAISSHQLPIGHLKFFLQSGDWQQKISYTSSKNERVENSHVKITANYANLLVNARVETNPDQLKKILFQTIKKVRDINCNIELLDLASFQPGYPKPTYRFFE